MMDDLNLDSAMDSIAAEISSGSVEKEVTAAEPVVEAKAEVPKESTPTQLEIPSIEAPPSTEAKPSVPDAPRTWRPEAAQSWATLPENVQKEILKREEDMFKGIEEYKGKASAAQPLLEAIKPYMPVMQQHGIRPEVMVKNLLNAQYLLTTGSPQQKVAMMQKLAHDYGVEWGADAGMIDPKTSELEQRLARIEQGKVDEIRQGTMKEVETFVSELGPDGQPLRPYFDDVADDIVGLINAGQAATLQEAYEKAIWLNPVTREKEISRVSAATAAKAQKAAEEARKAEAANVKTSAKAVTADSPTGSMDDTMMETLRAIKSRAA